MQSAVVKQAEDKSKELMWNLVAPILRKGDAAFRTPAQMGRRPWRISRYYCLQIIIFLHTAAINICSKFPKKISSSGYTIVATWKATKPKVIWTLLTVKLLEICKLIKKRLKPLLVQPCFIFQAWFEIIPNLYTYIM